MIQDMKLTLGTSSPFHFHFAFIDVSDSIACKIFVKLDWITPTEF